MLQRIKALLFPLLLLIGSVFVLSVVIELGYRTYLFFSNPATILSPDGIWFNPNGSGEYRGGLIKFC